MAAQPALSNIPPKARLHGGHTRRIATCRISLLSFPAHQLTILFGMLRRPLEDETQPRSALLPGARDLRIVRIHGAVIRTLNGTAFEVQSRFLIGDGGDQDPRNVLVRVVDRAT